MQRAVMDKHMMLVDKFDAAINLSSSFAKLLKHFAGSGICTALMNSPNAVASQSSLLEELTPLPSWPYMTKWTAFKFVNSTLSTK